MRVKSQLDPRSDTGIHAKTEIAYEVSMFAANGVIVVEWVQ
jgi:hypothetical protein